MKKLIVVFVILFGVVISGCGKTTVKPTKTSSQSSKQKIETAKKTQHYKRSTTSEGSRESETISGVWMATGKEDGVTSTWYFHNGHLVVNYVYKFSYVVAKTKDSNGYTVVTIKNNEGKQHELLLKRNGSNFEGITAEGEAYDHYLADGTVPKGQLIEFKSQKNVWGSKDEAIDFWENTFKNTDNAISKEMDWKNYRRDLWHLVKNGTSGNTLTLHFTNISGAGGSYDQLVKNDKNTVITTYDGNASYPNHPTMRYTVRNEDNKVIKTEVLWKQK